MITHGCSSLFKARVTICLDCSVGCWLNHPESFSPSFRQLWWDYNRSPTDRLLLIMSLLMTLLTSNRIAKLPAGDWWFSTLSYNFWWNQQILQTLWITSIAPVIVRPTSHWPLGSNYCCWAQQHTCRALEVVPPCTEELCLINGCASAGSITDH